MVRRYPRLSHDPKATPAAFVEVGGALVPPGDLGKVDVEAIFMVDRLKRMINASGFKVWPAESKPCCSRIRPCSKPA